MRERLTPVKIHSRKIKKSSPSSPFTSALTRSKALIFSHQNRSGFSRPDPVTSKPIPEMEPLDSFLGVKCRSASRVFLTKDLRHKRVFSQDVDSVPQEENEDDDRKKLLKGFDASTDPDDLKGEGGLEETRIVRSEAEGERIDGAIGPNLKDQAVPKIKMALNGSRRRKVFKTPSSFSYRRMLPHLMDIVNDSSSVSEIEIVDAGSPCKYPKLDGVNFKRRSVAEDRYAAKTECVAPQFDDSKPSENLDLEKVHIKLSYIQPDLSTANSDVEEKGRENDVNGIDASVEEEHIQTTPPDTALFAKIEDGYGGESVDANKVLADNQTFVGLPVGSEKKSSDTIKQSPNTKCSTNSMNTTVLNPCSRLKLFKNPRSLSYRRLLPFLVDISKNSSCSSSSRKPQQKMPQVVSQEDRHPAIAAGAEQDNVNNTAKQNYEKKCSEDLIQDNLFSMVPRPASDGSSPDSCNNLVSSISESPASNYASNVGPRSVNLATLPDLGMLTEEIPRSQNNPAKLQLDFGSKESNSTVSEPPSIVNNDILTVQCTSEEPKSIQKQKMCSSMGLELRNDNAESIELVNLKQHSFQIKVLDALVSPKNRPFKGILKRNRRGCRGLCDCLNCASFRLHAERAFEFSRNQLHDAGEVATELMKEIANLRLLLQKSITENDDSSPVLVKQACTKALEAETLAKERLDELNSDLIAHCKTPVLLQPKVTFAYNI